MSKYNKKLEMALTIAEKTVKIAIKRDNISEGQQKALFVETFNALISD